MFSPLKGGCAYVEPPEDFEISREYDISLISGRLRGMGGGSEKPVQNIESSDCEAVVKKDQTVSIVHAGGAGTANATKLDNFFF